MKLVFLANPNSPSGTVIPPEQVLALAERLPCPLFVDEAYADFADTHCMHLVARNPKIMVSRSLSKSYALAGLRFGYVVAQPPLITELVKVKDSYNCDALAIAGATALTKRRAFPLGDREALPCLFSGWLFGFVEVKQARLGSCVITTRLSCRSMTRLPTVPKKLKA